MKSLLTIAFAATLACLASIASAQEVICKDGQCTVIQLNRC